MSDCSLCKSQILIPQYGLDKFLKPYVKKWNKTCSEKSYSMLKVLKKLSIEIEDYIILNSIVYTINKDDKYITYNISNEPGASSISEDNNFFAVRNFLYENISKYEDFTITCSKCNNKFCEFHEKYSGFIHVKCIDCKKPKSYCGYCIDGNTNKFLPDKHKCLECYNNKIKCNFCNVVSDSLDYDCKVIDCIGCGMGLYICYYCDNFGFVSSSNAYCKYCEEFYNENPFSEPIKIEII